MSTPTKARPKKPKHRPGQPENPEQKHKPCLSLALHPKRILQIKICEGVLNSYISYSNWRFFSEILIFLKFLKLINCKAENGYVIREKKSPNLESVGFLGMSVGCPDKIHLCWKKCSTDHPQLYFYFRNKRDLTDIAKPNLAYSYNYFLV